MLLFLFKLYDTTSWFFDVDLFRPLGAVETMAGSECTTRFTIFTFTIPCSVLYMRTPFYPHNVFLGKKSTSYTVEVNKAQIWFLSLQSKCCYFNILLTYFTHAKRPPGDMIYITLSTTDYSKCWWCTIKGSKAAIKEEVKKSFLWCFMRWEVHLFFAP